MVRSWCRNRDCGVIFVYEGCRFHDTRFGGASFEGGVARQHDQTTLEDVYDVFKLFDEDPDVFKKLRYSAFQS